VRRSQLKLTDSGPPPGRLDAAVEAVLIALLAFMPFAFGAVEAWSGFLAVAASLALAVLLVVRRVTRPDLPPAWTWAYVPLVLFVLLALLQLAPLPGGLLRVLSPETLAAKSRLLADLPGDGPAETTLSFYPRATRDLLVTVLVASAVFVSVVEVYRRPQQVRRLLLAVTLVGGAVALLALAQDVTRSDKIYWLVPSAHQLADGGPFVNHNNFAQFMNLSIGAALGLLVLKLREAQHGGEAGASDVLAAFREPESRSAWLYAGVVVAGVVAVLMSMSRGGMIGMAAGFALAAAGLGRRRQLRNLRWVIAVLVLVAFAGVVYVGIEAVFDRVAAVRNFEQASGGRARLVQDALRVWRKYPLLGTGLGTHAYVFPAYDTTGAPQAAAHVENEYVQSLEETGLIGLLLALSFAAVIWANFAVAAKAERPRVSAAAFGLGYGLLAVMVHSVTDFGQRLPAVAGLTAATCGLLVALAQLARRAKAAPQDADENEEAPVPLEPARPARLRAAVPVALVLAAGWLASDAWFTWQAASEAADAGHVASRLARAGWDGGDDDFTVLLTHAGAASDARPDDVELRYWLNVYRWRALARERDPESGDLLLTEQALGFVRRIVDELHAARPLCPAYGPLLSLAGQLELFVLDDKVGLDHIRTAQALAPNHADVVYSAAMADAVSGDLDAAVAKFKRAVELDPTLVRDAVGVFENQLGRPDLAVAVAEHGTDIVALMDLAERLKKKGGDARVAAAARAATIRKLAEASEGDKVYPWIPATLGEMYRQDGNYEAAINAYNRALNADYGAVEARLGLARTLADAGRRQEALEQVEKALRLRPEMPTAKQLLVELRAQPSSTQATRPSARK
jgi:O-antigen ligase/tetratricopeptide (TPR) repeat protein